MSDLSERQSKHTFQVAEISSHSKQNQTDLNNLLMCERAFPSEKRVRTRRDLPLANTACISQIEDFPRFGGHSASETPGPIPNPEVKHCCADGTAS